MAVNNWFRISGTFTLPAGTNLRYVVELLADEAVTDSEDASTVDPGVFETGTVAESGGTASITTGQIPANSNHTPDVTNWRFTVYQTGPQGTRRAQVETHVDVVGSPGLNQTTIDYASLPTSVGLPVVTDPPSTRLVDLSDVSTPIDTYVATWDGTAQELDWQTGVPSADPNALYTDGSRAMTAGLELDNTPATGAGDIATTTARGALTLHDGSQVTFIYPTWTAATDPGATDDNFGNSAQNHSFGTGSTWVNTTSDAFWVSVDGGSIGNDAIWSRVGLGSNIVDFTPTDSGWSVTNLGGKVRTIDVDATTMDGIADVLGSVIQQLLDYGVVDP